MNQGICDSFDGANEACTKAAQECMSTTRKQEAEIQKLHEENAALKARNEALQKQNAELQTSRASQFSELLQYKDRLIQMNLKVDNSKLEVSPLHARFSEIILNFDEGKKWWESLYLDFQTSKSLAKNSNSIAKEMVALDKVLSHISRGQAWWQHLSLNVTQMNDTTGEKLLNITAQKQELEAFYLNIEAIQLREALNNIVVSLQTQFNDMHHELETVQANLNALNITGYISNMTAVSREASKIKKDYAIPIRREALDEIYMTLHAVKEMQDLGESYQERSKSVVCYTTKLWDCSGYHNNLKRCEYYYHVKTINIQCPATNDYADWYCLLYKREVDGCRSLLTHPEVCRRYEAKKHHDCYEIPKLCADTTSDDVVRMEKFRKQQLFFLRTHFKSKERELGFVDHEYNTEYDQEEEALELQKEAINKASEHFDTLYGEGAANTKGVIEKLMTKFQQEYCASHPCGTAMVQTFAIQQTKGCPAISFFNITVQDEIEKAIPILVGVVEDYCDRKISC